MKYYLAIKKNSLLIDTQHGSNSKTTLCKPTLEYSSIIPFHLEFKSRENY